MIRFYRDDWISWEAVCDQWRSAPWWLKPMLPFYWAVWWLCLYFVPIFMLVWAAAIGIVLLVALVYVPFRPPPLVRKIAAWIVSWF